MVHKRVGVLNSKSNRKQSRPKKSPNSELIALLKEPEVIPYDPELFKAISLDAQKSWNQLEKLRIKLYRRVLPWFGSALAEAVKDFDCRKEKEVQLRADREWKHATRAPAVTSFENLDEIRVKAKKAGYSGNDDASLLVWASEAVQFVGPKSPKEWADQYEISERTLSRMIKDGQILIDQISTKRIRIARADVDRHSTKTI